MNPLLAIWVIAIAAAAFPAAQPVPDGITPEERETFIGLRAIAAVMHTFEEATGTYLSTEGALRPVDGAFIRACGEPYASYLPAEDGWGRAYYIATTEKRLITVSSGANGTIDDPEAILALLSEPFGSIYGAKTIDSDDVIAIGYEIAKRAKGHRERQLETVAMMRLFALALAAYIADHQSCPPLDGMVHSPEVEGYLVPEYLRNLDRRDGWDTEFLVWCKGADYIIISAGGDRNRDEAYSAMEDPLREITARGTFTDPSRDIVVMNGEFLTIPYGITR